MLTSAWIKFDHIPIISFKITESARSLDALIFVQKIKFSLANDDLGELAFASINWLNYCSPIPGDHRTDSIAA